ncbi:MAG: phosphoglycerate dehydrogenase [Acidimicrobiales bacterium]
MGRVLVTEQLADPGIEQMRAAGHDVEIRLGLSPDELLGAVGGVEGLVIRSATKVTEEVLRAGRSLKVVGRAGIGLDNVDVAAATSLGVMIVNAPESNILSAAEHALALLLSQARNVPQAHAALVEGRWERSRWEGVELSGKTLGVVGLGRIGGLVAQRALSFGMRLVAYDPYVSAERARQTGIELLSLDDLVATSDFITIHLPKTPETLGLFGKELLSKVKPGVRIVNAARGGIIDEAALADAISSGRVAGAALDVFAEEPAVASPLFDLPQVVVTPHLGASTKEAQDKAGIQIAEQVNLALAGDFVPYAVNVAAGSASKAIRPYLSLAEDLGRFIASLCEGLPEGLAVTYEGALAGEDTRILTLAVLKGVFAASTEEPVSYVNAPVLASERGLEVTESSTATTRDYLSRVTVRAGGAGELPGSAGELPGSAGGLPGGARGGAARAGGAGGSARAGHSVAATLAGSRQIQRIVMVDDHDVELPFAPNLLVVRNDDRAGMIGIVGTALGEAGVSIHSMAVGQTEGGAGTALMLLSTDVPVPADVAVALRRHDGILGVHQVLGPWSSSTIAT